MEALGELDLALSLRTYLVGHAVTLADLCVWAALKGVYTVCIRSLIVALHFSAEFLLLPEQNAGLQFVIVSLQVMQAGRARGNPSPTPTAGSPS